MVVVGDGSQKPIAIWKDKLCSMDPLMEIGRQIAMPKTIKETRSVLGDKVFGYVCFLRVLIISTLLLVIRAIGVSIFFSVGSFYSVCRQTGVQHWDLRL